LKKHLKRNLQKNQRSFILAWSSTSTKKTWDRFHHNFKEEMKAHPTGCRDVNLGEITNA
jgi:hypothetical protein